MVLYPRAGSMWRSEAPPAPSVGSASASSVGCLVREAGWVLKGPGGARWSAVAASTRVCTRAFVSILLLSNSPRLKTSADLALQFSFLCSLGACYARSPRDIFGGNARLSVFFALQTYKFSSSAFLGIPLSRPFAVGSYAFAFFSLSSHSVRYFPVVPGYSGVKEISHHTYPTLEISH